MAGHFIAWTCVMATGCMVTKLGLCAVVREWVRGWARGRGPCHGGCRRRSKRPWCILNVIAVVDRVGCEMRLRGLHAAACRLGRGGRTKHVMYVTRDSAAQLRLQRRQVDGGGRW